MKRDRDEARCREPLDLSPVAQKAFVDRQAKLLDNDKWLLRNWYNDEDFCRAYNTAVALLAKVEGLQSIVDELPKTADGVPVVPGMTVYHRDWQGKVTEERSLWAPPYPKVFSCCYSTREAAEGESQKAIEQAEREAAEEKEKP